MLNFINNSLIFKALDKAVYKTNYNFFKNLPKY